MSEEAAPPSAVDQVGPLVFYLVLVGMLALVAGLLTLGVGLARGRLQGEVAAGLAGAGLALLAAAVGLHRGRPWARRALLAGGPLVAAALTVVALLEAVARPSVEAVKPILVTALLWLEVVHAVRVLRRPEVRARFAGEAPGRWRALASTALEVVGAYALLALFALVVVGVGWSRLELLARVRGGPPTALDVLLTLAGALASGLVVVSGLALAVGLVLRRRRLRALTPEVVARLQALALEGKSLREIREHEARAGRPLEPWVVEEALSGLPESGPPPPVADDGRGRVAAP